VPGSVPWGGESTRREAIKRGLALAGVAGAAATGRILLDAAPAAADGRSPGGNAPDGTPAGGGTSVSYGGRNFDAWSPELVRGTLPAPGDRLLIVGQLLDVGGAVVGEVFGAYLQLPAFGDAGPGDPTSLHEHTFTFNDGTIHGRGLASADLDAANTFAIVGGTGRYVGLLGSYTAIERFFGLGGDGTAQITLTTTREGSDHGS
jgi:Allene oxide cyclase barrel like domain